MISECSLLVRFSKIKVRNDVSNSGSSGEKGEEVCVLRTAEPSTIRNIFSRQISIVVSIFIAIKNMSDVKS